MVGRSLRLRIGLRRLKSKKSKFSRGRILSSVRSSNRIFRSTLIKRHKKRHKNKSNPHNPNPTPKTAARRNSNPSAINPKPRPPLFFYSSNSNNNRSPSLIQTTESSN
jgi:hypothetical protein